MELSVWIGSWLFCHQILDHLGLVDFYVRHYLLYNSANVTHYLPPLGSPVSVSISLSLPHRVLTCSSSRTPAPIIPHTPVVPGSPPPLSPPHTKQYSVSRLSYQKINSALSWSLLTLRYVQSFLATPLSSSSPAPVLAPHPVSQ